MSSQKPFFSICIPTYNQTKHLVKTLNSILNQTFQDFEIIISDDSSTNDVENLILQYQSRYSKKILYVKNIQPLGSPENWNYVISLATGLWIKIMHHDDWFCQDDALDKFRLAVKNRSNAMIFAGIKGDFIIEKRHYINLPSVEKIEEIKLDPFSLIWANIIGPPSTILFPNINIKFDRNLIWLVDIDFYLQLMLYENMELVYIQEVLFENEPDSHNITNYCFQNKQLELKEFNYLFNKYFPKSSFKTRLKFMYKLKKHISSYASVNVFELFRSNIIHK